MNLDDIILSIKADDFSNLYTLLTQSGCNKSRKTLHNLQQGKDIYESISPFYDSISKIILLSKNFASIILLQQYHKLRNQLLQSIKFAVIYPAILLVVEFFLFVSTSYILTVPWITMILDTIITVGVFYYLYHQIYKQYVQIILLYNLLALCNSTINYRQLESIVYFLKHKISHSQSYHHIQGLSKWCCGYDFINKSRLIYDIQYQQNNLELYIKSLPNWFTTILLLQIGYFCYLFISNYHSFIIRHT